MTDLPALPNATAMNETLTNRSLLVPTAFEAAEAAADQEDAALEVPNLMAEYAASMSTGIGDRLAIDDASSTDLDGAQPDGRLLLINKALLVLPLGYAIRFSGCSTRLVKAADRAGFNHISLQDYLSDPTMLVRDLHQQKGIGRKTIDEAVEKVEKFVSTAARVSAAASSGTTTMTQSAPRGDGIEQRGDAAGPDLAPSTEPVDLRSPHERLADAVARLPDKEQFVIEGRYGFNGQAERTLQELADEAQVTRERIRQIEAKALRHLRLPMHRVLLNEFLRAEKDAIWNVVACGNDLVSPQEFRDGASRLDSWQRLAIELVHGNLHEWLAQHATAVGAGWLRHGADPEQLRKATADLELFAEGHALPMPTATVSNIAEIDQDTLDLAAQNSSLLTLFEGYLVEGRAGARTRRTLRMHAVAARLGGSSMFDIATIAGLYRGEYPDDAGGPRVIQMQMQEATNLFCRLYDNLWFALPTTIDIGSLAHLPFERDMVLEPTFEDGTIGAHLAGILAAGPRRHVDLKAEMAGALGDRIAETSAGAVLAANPCFRRVAPGIFDLCRPGSVYDEHGVLNELFLDERQCRAFCLARFGGAPVDWYPAWGPSLELWLTRWARVKAEPDLFRSLMFVGDPSSWPAPADELDYWGRVKVREGAWLLGAERRSRLGRRFIEPAQFLSTLAHLVFFGWTSWVAVNRTTDARGDVHDAADILAILVKAGLAQAESNWQAKHTATPLAAVVFHRACHEMHVNGALAWESGVLAELWATLTATADGERVGWIEPDEFAEALELWRKGEARSSRAFTRKTAEAVDPAPIFETGDWGRLFSAD